MFTSRARRGLALGAVLQPAMVGTGHVGTGIAQLFEPLGALVGGLCASPGNAPKINPLSLL